MYALKSAIYYREMNMSAKLIKTIQKYGSIKSSVRHYTLYPLLLSPAGGAVRRPPTSDVLPARCHMPDARCQTSAHCQRQRFMGVCIQQVSK